jgi:hypothetical protein
MKPTGGHLLWQKSSVEPPAAYALFVRRRTGWGYDVNRITDPDGNELLFPLDETNDRQRQTSNAWPDDRPGDEIVRGDLPTPLSGLKPESGKGLFDLNFVGRLKRRSAGAKLTARGPSRRPPSARPGRD